MVFQKILKFLDNDKKSYLQRWKPAEHKVLKNKKLRDELDINGYAKANTLSNEIINELIQLYNDNHQLKSKNGGLFLGIHSPDKDYRNIVHNNIKTILQNEFDKLFEDYKNMFNSYITKTPGPNSEFDIHQDKTCINELEYSPITIWIPLQDTDMMNGGIAIIPKSHGVLSPFRGTDLPDELSKVKEFAKNYLQPIQLKAGEILLFDNRTIHHSPPNFSSKNRLVVVCDIFPMDAFMMTCMKNESDNEKNIVTYKYVDGYVLKVNNVNAGILEQNEFRKIHETHNWKFHQFSKEDFKYTCKHLNIPKTSHPQLLKSYTTFSIKMANNSQNLI